MVLGDQTDLGVFPWKVEEGQGVLVVLSWVRDDQGGLEVPEDQFVLEVLLP